MKFPMAPEATMAVILRSFANMIGAVRCLTSWYGVIAETTILSEGKSELHDVAMSISFESMGVTGSVGLTSFLTCQGLWLSQWSLLPRPEFWFLSGGIQVGGGPALHSQSIILPSDIWRVHPLLVGFHCEGSLS
jgi:hypothetical protein